MKYYLDTSALVKRYIPEPGSEHIDRIFTGALNGENVIAISYWNIGEAATVFDKAERKFKSVNATKLLELMLDEFDYLSRSQSIEIDEVSALSLKASVKLVLKHHIYIADAFQIVTAAELKAEELLSDDRRLVEAASVEGIKSTLVDKSS